MYHGYSSGKTRNRRTKREDKQLLQGIILITALAIFAGILLIAGILN